MAVDVDRLLPRRAQRDHVYADHCRFYVADAGGNSVLRVGRSGRIRALAFGNLPNPTPVGPPQIQTVPTGVVKGPDGALSMSQLTGLPFLPGAANVYRIDPRTGERSVYASGFTNAIDLDFGRDGTLYVLEIDADGLFPATGGPSTDGGLWALPRRAAADRAARRHADARGRDRRGAQGRPLRHDRSDEAGDGEVLKIDLD